jgi:hypothetical protein
VNPYYPEVARRAGHRCEYCRAPEGAFNFPFEVEHVAPTSRGGTDEPSNLALSCRACNVRKGDAVSGADYATGGEAALFDPRADRWSDHLRFDVDSAELIGLTPVGRATIARLDLNHPLQLAARHVWVQLRLYP